MGRLEHLTRLALGRSAFEDPEPNEQEANAGQTTQDSDGRYVQQYDAKGRPFSPRTEAFNTRMRNAMNDILSLTLVVERKDDSERNIERRDDVLADEHARGELLDLALSIPISLAQLWPDAILQRVQIGLYAAETPFSAILSREVHALWQGESTLRNIASMFPGTGVWIAYIFVRVPLTIAVQQVSGKMQNLLRKRRFSRRTINQLHHLISQLADCLCDAIYVLLLPLNFHSTAQNLGLAPSLPLWPTVKGLWPWHASSFHKFGWKPIRSNLYLIGLIASPAALMLLNLFYIRPPPQDSASPVFTFSTCFRWPPIDADAATVRKNHPRFLGDPFCWVTYQIWSWRQAFLCWAGWTVVQIETRDTSRPLLENNTVIDTTTSDMQAMPVHRSTALAHLPANTLATAVDSLLARLITLPFDSLLLRVVAASYMSSSWPKSSRARAAAPALYAPFGGGPLSRLRQGAWGEVGSYASKLGLALALRTGVDLLLFAGVYLAAC